MRIILIEYIAFVNLIGFLLMWFDKRAARRHGWRIPEKVLLGIAVIGGSIGTLIAMYLLRHKTRHLAFTAGVPLILLVQLLLAGMLSFRKHEELVSPSTTVKNELNLIQELDEGAIESILSYDDLLPAQAASTANNQDAAAAIRAFFGNFRFRIVSEQIRGDDAEVIVDITNIDTHALARDLCLSLTETSLSLDPNISAPAALGNYFTLLKDTLDSHTYETGVTQAVFRLSREDNKDWTIVADETLEDELVSRFITHMNDPHLLSAEEVAGIQLEQFEALSPRDWIEWLGVHDLFDTGSETLAEEIDLEYFTRLCDCFSCKLLSCEEEGDRAQAEVTFTSVDLHDVLAAYREDLLAYASDPENITNGAAALADDSAAYLLEALREKASQTETTAVMHLKNDGHFWKPEIDEAVIDAMCGGLASSLEEFAEAGS